MIRAVFAPSSCHDTGATASGGRSSAGQAGTKRAAGELDGGAGRGQGKAKGGKIKLRERLEKEEEAPFCHIAIANTFL